MQGDGGRSAEAASLGTSVTLGPACVELWGGLAYSSNPCRIVQVN
jgi:hypothetical protein